MKSGDFLLAQTRQAMLEASGLTADDLRDAIRTHRRLLTAKTTKFFAHEGVVVDEREVDDNDAQKAAVDLLYDVVGLKAPRAPAQTAGAIAVAVEIDPATGVIRVVAGHRQASLPTEAA